MAEGERSITRKATIEIQRRPGRAGTVQGTRRAEPGVAAKQLPTDPSEIPRVLTEVYAPDGFDDKSAILACNFPSGVNMNECRNFFAWIGPVIRVDRGPSIMQESNFIVVFASTDAAKAAQLARLTYDDGKTPIFTRLVDQRETLWVKVTNYFGSSKTSQAAQPIRVANEPSATASAGAWLSSAGEATGSAFNNAGNSISESWTQSGATEVMSNAGSAVGDAFRKASTAVQGYMGVAT